MFEIQGIVIGKHKDSGRLIPYYKVKCDTTGWDYQTIEQPIAHFTELDLKELHPWLTPLINEKALISAPLDGTWRAVHPEVGRIESGGPCVYVLQDGKHLVFRRWDDKPRGYELHGASEFIQEFERQINVPALQPGDKIMVRAGVGEDCQRIVIIKRLDDKPGYLVCGNDPGCSGWRGGMIVYEKSYDELAQTFVLKE